MVVGFDKHMLMRKIIDDYAALRSAYYDKKISSMRQVVNDWSGVCMQERRLYYERLKDVVDICLQHSNAKKQIIEQHRHDGHLFNTFSLWNRFTGISEPTHSRILHFLLSDDNLHGQGNLFLLELLKMLNVESPEMGQWIPSAELGRVDVRLVRQNPRSVVVIENKSNWAGDQPNQLYRYWYNNIHSCAEDCLPGYYQDNDRFKIVYLVPNEIKQISNQSLLKPSIDWFLGLSKEEYDSLPDILPLTPIIWSFDTQINQWLQKCEDLLNERNTPLRNFIKQYRMYCNEL